MKTIEKNLKNANCNEIADFALTEFGIEAHDWTNTDNAESMRTELVNRMATLDIVITETKRTTKGERFAQKATIVDAYTACQGNMHWESPVIVFELADGRKVNWLTDDEEWLYMKGTSVQLGGFYYEATNRIRRVTINGQPAAKVNPRKLA